MMKRFSCEKLARDNVIAQCLKEGIKLSYHMLDKEAQIHALKQKLIEEAEEVFETKETEDVIEELADVKEVMLVLMQKLGIKETELEAARAKKRLEMGGFMQGIYVHHVDVALDSPRLNHFLNQPKKYPQLPIKQEEKLFDIYIGMN